MAENATAIAICGEKIAPTVGSAESFIFLSGNAQRLVPRECGIALFLEKHNIKTLICGNIGNCLLEVLRQKNIEVIPGVSGGWQDAAAAFRNRTLHCGKNYTCSEQGQICGDCPGNY